MWDSWGGQKQRLRDGVYVNNKREGEIHIPSTNVSFFYCIYLWPPVSVGPAVILFVCGNKVDGSATDNHTFRNSSSTSSCAFMRAETSPVFATALSSVWCEKLLEKCDKMVAEGDAYLAS